MITWQTTTIDGVIVIETTASTDHRGSFSRLFCVRELAPVLRDRPIVQINRSVTSTTGAIRGLHYQNPPDAETKIVRCLKGRVFDVAVDLRRGSPTFLKWVGIELSAGRGISLMIPEGCAHGFQVLEPDSELLYMHTQYYTPASEGAVRFDDPTIGVAWPLPSADLSARDLGHPLLTPRFEGITL